MPHPKRTSILAGLAFLCLAFTRSQEPRPMVLKAAFDFFTTDNIGNIYTVKEDELIKYLPDGKFFARYSNLRLGSISSVDVTNPLKIVLYYRDFQQIIFLDNQLSINSEIVSLEKLGYEQTDLVCASANNSFWIFSKQNNELYRFNENSRRITATGNLKQVLNTDLSPNYMMEYNGYLYMNCPETGIYVFDIFGTFNRIIAIRNLSQFQVNDNILYYQKDSSFCSYNYVLFEEACKKLPFSLLPTSVKYGNNRLYSAFKDSLVIREF